MLRDGESYSVCTGLEVRVAGDIAGMTFPRATIRLHSTAEAPGEADDPGSAIMVHLSPGRLHMLLNNASLADALLAGDAAEFSIDNPVLVRRIAQEILRSDYTGDCLGIFLKGKIVELLVELLARPQRHGNGSAAMAARDILLRDPLAPPTMGELSRLVGVTQRKLSSEFQQAFGFTVPEWLADWRLTRGHDLVMEGSASMAEIAASLGYAHLSTFTVAFTKRFGQPPTRLRSGTTATSRS
jgi:AraC-like DNA-binding protein